MSEVPSTTRCGIDTVEVARVERLLESLEPGELAELFTAGELADAGEGAGRAKSLAARFAAKEACCKLFPKETSLGWIGPADFSVRGDGYGAPRVEASDRAKAVINRYRVASINLSLTHTKTSASAVAVTEMVETKVPWYGKWTFLLVRYRRDVVLNNIRRAFGDVLPEEEIVRLAQANYGHFVRFALEFLKLPFMSKEGKKKWIRMENGDALKRADAKGKGMLLLTGHFGNWEVATVAGISQFSEYEGRFHFVRRPLKPAFFNDYVARRFHKAGFGTIDKEGSMDDIFDVLENGGIVVIVFDQHATLRRGVPVDFLGSPANTFKSLAILAQSTGVPVVPASSWREEDGSHVLRFEEELKLVECEDMNQEIVRNTRIFNIALERMMLRHPEQWIWMHQRWKIAEYVPESPGAGRGLG